MNTKTDDTTILDVIVNENDKRITLNKRKGYGNEPFFYEFLAELPGRDETEDWISERCETLEQAIEWIKTTEGKRKRAKRTSYNFPVTVKQSARHGSHVYYMDAAIHGVHATTGKWRISVGGRKTSADSSRLYRRMTADDARKSKRLSDEIATAEKALAALQDKHSLDLPYTASYRGRLGVDEAIYADTKMAELFTDK